MLRGVGRIEIFLVNDDYSELLEYVEKAGVTFGLDIFAFVLMNNYYRLKPEMLICKMYTGLKNKATLRVNIQREKQKNLGKRIEKIAYSTFARLSENVRYQHLIL